MLGTTSKEMP